MAVVAHAFNPVTQKAEAGKVTEILSSPKKGKTLLAKCVIYLKLIA